MIKTTNEDCPHCSGDNFEIDTCDACGNTYYTKIVDNEETGCSGIFFNALGVLILGLWCAILTDETFFYNQYFNSIYYGSACDYVMPNNFKIVSDEVSGKYAIKDLRTANTYITSHWLIFSNRLNTSAQDIQHPDIFRDSCNAKAVLKVFIEQESPMVHYK